MDDVTVSFFWCGPWSVIDVRRQPRFVIFSKQLRELAKTRGAVFISTMRPPLAEPSGRLAKAMSDDGQHLNDAGYEVLARWIADEGGAATAPLRTAAK